MNYRIVCNTPVNGTYTDFVLFDYTVEGRELSKAVLTRSFNGNFQDGQLVFTIHPGHYAYDKIMLSLSTITVYDGETEIFRGRPVSLQTSKTLLKTYTVEHMMKFLIDVPDVFSTEDADGNVDLSLAIPAVINGYNSMVPANRQIALPSSIPITGKAKASKGASVYSNLSAWIASVGYYAKIVKNTVDSNVVYSLSFATDTGVIMDNTNDFRVVFRENILDYAETVNLDKLYTAVYPVGVDSGNEAFTPLLLDGNTTDPVIEDVPDYSVDTSKHLIRNDNAVPDYGLVILYAEIDLKDEPSKTRQTVYNRGVRALQNAAGATESFTISAVDPRLVGMEGSVPIEGCYYLVTIPPFFGDEAVPQKLTQIVTDMTKPSSGSLTFGGSRNLLTDQSATTSTAASRAGGAAASAQKTAQRVANGDYIVGTVTDGIWTYHKWSSGLVECWGVSSVTVPANGWNGSGSTYYINGSEAFPSGLFVSVPELWVHPGNDNLGGDMFLYAAKHEPVTAATAKYRLIRNDNLSQQITIGVNLYAVGKWK